MVKTAENAQIEQMESPYFICSECGEPVILFNGRKFFTCPHVTSAQAILTDVGAKKFGGDL